MDVRSRYPRKSMVPEDVAKARRRFWGLMEDRLGPATFHEHGRFDQVVEFRPRLSRQ